MTTLTGATFAGVVATALMAAPAMACKADLAVDKTCDTATNQVKVTFTISNDFSKNATLKDVSATPTLTKIIKGAKVPKNGTLSDTVSVKPGDTVSLGYTASWWGQRDYVVSVLTVDTKTVCPAPTTPPAGGGGGGTTPTPTPTATAAPSATPSASKPAVAAPTLPVTGSSTGLYAGGAVVLLGAGAGLFVMSRRRRVKFEA